MLQDSLPGFRELRMFAMEEIPRILREEGGTIAKTELHSRVKELFARSAGGWPNELDGMGRSGCTRGTNAIAWALATLTSRMVTHPCLGSDVVRLRRHGQPRESGGSMPKPREQDVPDHSARIEVLVRERARQAMARAACAGLPFDDSFIEDSVLAVRMAGIDAR